MHAHTPSSTNTFPKALMETLDFSSLLSLTMPIILLLLLSDLSSLRATNVGDDRDRVATYIIHVQPPKTAPAFADVDEQKSWYKSFLPSDSAEDRLVHPYTTVVTGFAARLTPKELAGVSKMPGFVAAYPDQLYSLQTTHTPDFLGLPFGGVWNASDFGKGIIIGVLDSGIFPDHPSFSGDAMPPPPAKWKGRCELNASQCNNKLIGARAFLSGVNAIKGAGAVSASPIDEVGHGTHTTSTAAGAGVPGAQVLGNANGYAVGMAPLAHVAMYRVCGLESCAASDLLAGMDAAVSDGVDILSLSIGGGSLPFYNDSIALGAFGAIEKGVLVSCAGGNGGPYPSTLANEAPWILTVAAGTMDRNIRSTVRLGNGLQLDGESAFRSSTTFYPLVYAGDSGTPGAEFCGNGSLDGFDVKGKIVLCQVGGDVARIIKGSVVQSAGGVGIIVMNVAPYGYTTFADAHVLPASHISYADGVRVQSYLNKSSNPIAAILFKGTILGTSPAPAIAGFSSRGPSLASPGILKPDITGPGVNVLAAWPFHVGPSTVTFPGPQFNIISGTSMSTPHLSGIAALLKSAHPDWSPAAIKSAIMTTADVVDRSGNLIVDEQHVSADFFATGAGFVNPNKANDPGLIYDLSAYDYIPYLCGLGYTSAQVTVIARHAIDCSAVKSIAESQLNYPSITVSFTPATTSVSIQRTVRNIGEAASVYTAEVESSDRVRVMVVPSKLEFTEVNEEKSFWVIISKEANNNSGEVLQGYLKWVSETRVVRSPITITFTD